MFLCLRIIATRYVDANHGNAWAVYFTYYSFLLPLQTFEIQDLQRTHAETVCVSVRITCFQFLLYCFLSVPLFQGNGTAPLYSYSAYVRSTAFGLHPWVPSLNVHRALYPNDLPSHRQVLRMSRPWLGETVNYVQNRRTWKCSKTNIQKRFVLCALWLNDATNRAGLRGS